MIRMSDRFRLPFLLVLALASLPLAGCLDTGQLDAVRRELAGCRSELAAQQSRHQAELARQDSEIERCRSLEMELRTRLPSGVQDVEAERQRILSAVPDAVRGEVGRRFDAYAARMASEFDALNESITTMRVKLDEAHRAIGTLQETTAGVDSNVRTMLTQRDSEIAALRSELDQRRSRASTLLAEIDHFDSRNLRCDRCPEEFRFKQKTKDRLLEFHSRIATLARDM